MATCPPFLVIQFFLNVYYLKYLNQNRRVLSITLHVEMYSLQQKDLVALFKEKLQHPNLDFKHLLSLLLHGILRNTIKRLQIIWFQLNSIPISLDFILNL